MGYRWMLLKELIWPHLRVKVSDITGVLDGLDKNDDDYITIEEVIDWCKTLGAKL